jgi:hypothetical protein
VIFYGLLSRNTAKPCKTRTFQASVFYKSRKNALERGRRKEPKKEEPVAGIDRKQAHGGGGEIRTHVPIARQPDFESGSL